MERRKHKHPGAIRHAFSIRGRTHQTIGLTEIKGHEYSLARLAALLSTPAVAIGPLLTPPWRDVRLTRTAIRRPGGAPSTASAASAASTQAVASTQAIPPGPAQAAATIRRRLGDHDRIALLFHGTAADVVLLHHTVTACRDTGRELLVVVPERVEPERGTSLAISTMTLLARLAGGFDIRVLEPRAQLAPGVWRPAMPATAPWESSLMAALVAARDWGATQMVVAGGADESFARPFPLRPALPAAVLHGVPLAAALATWGSAWGAPARWAGARVVAVPCRRGARARSASWLAELGRLGWSGTMETIAADRDLIARQPWFDADGAALPTVEAPLLAPGLTRGLLGPARPYDSARLLYDRRLATPYQRSRAALVRLLPPELREHLPADPPRERRRPIAAGELARLESSGLVEPALLPGVGAARLVTTLRAVDHWLRAADRWSAG